MSTQPFLPLFFGDLLAATPTWEGEARALYVLLLAYQWTAGPLPTDPKKIAKMCQYDTKTFTRLWSTVGKKFVKSGDGLVNARLEEHRVKAKEIAEKRANAGAKGAAKRWQETKQTDGKPMANAIDLSSHPSHPIQEESKSGCAALLPDPRKQVFDLGKTILGADSGGLISRAISLSGEAAVGAVLGEMARRPKADPRSYFVAATKPKQRGVSV
jgi:uncharacterized protein YdaU (DUF1376 family)